MHRFQCAHQESVLATEAEAADCWILGRERLECKNRDYSIVVGTNGAFGIHFDDLLCVQCESAAAANDKGRPPNVLLMWLTPPSIEGCWGSSVVEVEAQPGGLALEEATRSRDCLDLAWDLVWVGIFKIKKEMFKILYYLGQQKECDLSRGYPHTRKPQSQYIVNVALLTFANTYDTVQYIRFTERQVQ